jgi:beta-glucosidase
MDGAADRRRPALRQGSVRRVPRICRGSRRRARLWLGHGLGYGSWDYGEVRAARDEGAPTVTVDITNTSSRSSREVVQVYLDPAESDEPVRPVGWAAATVAPSETVTVEGPCDARLRRRWDETSGDWGTLGDGGELLVARGLGDVRARARLA